MSLKQLRERVGLRQVDVASKLNIDQSAVAKWETGKSKPCKKYHKKLAKILGCTVDALLLAMSKVSDAP